MKPADKLIFNRLAFHSGVNLPGIGSLRVELQSAQMTGKKLTPPLNRVLFSRHEDHAFSDLAALIAAEAGTDTESARRLYDKWLSSARVGNELQIEKVGVLKQDFFSVDPALNALLNPLPAKMIKLSPRRKTVWVILAPLPVILGCVAVVYFFDDRLNLPSIGFGNNPEPPGQEATITVPSRDSLPETDRKSLCDTLPNTFGVDSLISGTCVPTSGQTPDEQAISTTANVSESGLYHIVAGVYSTEENADKFIAKARQKADTLTFRKVPMPNGKIIVSIFSSPDKEQTEHRKRQLLRSDPSLWIYKSK